MYRRIQSSSNQTGPTIAEEHQTSEKIQVGWPRRRCGYFINPLDDAFREPRNAVKRFNPTLRTRRRLYHNEARDLPQNTGHLLPGANDGYTKITLYGVNDNRFA